MFPAPHPMSNKRKDEDARMKRTLKMLAAALVAGAAMSAPRGAWALVPCSPEMVQYSISQSLVSDAGPGIILAWLPERRVSLCEENDPTVVGGTQTREEVTGLFEVYRDGELIGSVSDTKSYRDTNTVAGVSYSYAIRWNGVMSNARSVICPLSFTSGVETTTLAMPGQGGSHAIGAMVLKQEWTNIHYGETSTTYGGPYYLRTTEMTWTATSDVDWIELSGTNANGMVNAKGTNAVAFFVLPNPKRTTRKGRISIAIQSRNSTYDGWVVQTVDVAQEAGPVPVEITLDANGGMVADTTIMRTCGDGFGELPTATRAGLKQDGWWTSATGGTRIADTTKVFRPLTLFARWVARVTFDAQGGTLAETTCDLQPGSQVGTLREPKAPLGWTFEGWYTAAEGGTRITGRTVVTEGVTFYAHWMKRNLGFTLLPDADWTQPLFVATTLNGTVPDTVVQQGQKLYVYFAFANLASDDAVGGSYCLFRLNNGAEFTQYCSPLAVGQVRSNKNQTVAPPELQNLSPGTYELTATLDYKNAVKETDETDNTRSVTFTVVASSKPTPTAYTVTFNPNGGSVSPKTRTVASGAAVGTLPTATRSGYTFAGWYTAASGGTKVSASTKVTANVTWYAHWTANGGGTAPVKPTPTPTPTPELVIVPELYEAVDGAVPEAVASVYDGYLYNKASGTISGTIQVKVGKPNKKTGLASVKATVIGPDGKKTSLKAAEKGKAEIAGNGPTTVSLVGGEVCTVTLGAKGMGGTYGAYEIDGALNVFASRDAADKETAKDVLGKWQGAVNVAWEEEQGWNGLSVAIANKGKAKVSGTLADGVKVTANGQLLVGEAWRCVPVLVTKKAQLAFALWLKRDGSEAVVAGLASAVVGKPGTLKGGARFRMGAPLGDAKFAECLPDGVPVTASGTKWVLPKAGKVAYLRGTTDVDEAKAGENPSALKLTYKAKDGTFKGTFKAYADANGKPKATTVNVAGVLVGGVGYGAATVKKAGGVAVTIE